MPRLGFGARIKSVSKSRVILSAAKDPRIQARIYSFA